MQVNERQQQVEELFHAALQLHAEERCAYLTRECSGDAPLRQEVESLIGALERRPDFIEDPFVSVVMHVLSHEAIGALVGHSIGQYKILRLLGRGGMGTVYLAEDTRLGRKVALKFIAHSLVDDEWARAQLINEAQAVVNLEDHRNICAVYAIEEIAGFNFIAMQYVEGQNLDSLIYGSPLNPERILDVVEQIACGISAAHARGIVHRDIKPQNIVVTPSGQVKVLDFGLANLALPAWPTPDDDGADPDEPAAPLLGTVAYMSPEQARGEALDERSDIFSLGIIIHEMLSRRHPFKRENGGATLAAIKTADTPQLKGLAPGLPVALCRIARRCLEKERARRYQTADELLRDLRKLRTGATLARYALPATALLLLLAAAVGFVYFRYSTTHTLAVRPVVNLTGDRDVDFLSAGLTRSLASRLAHLPRLHVRAPADSAKEQDGDVVGFGRALRAEAVLVNSIVRSDGVLRLQTSLVSVAGAETLWQESNPLDLTEIQKLQDRLALKTADGLRMWLSGDEQQRLMRHQTDNPEAQRLYWLGQYYWARRNQENIREAIKLFEHAVELDPLYAQAHAALADSYMFLPTVAFGPERTADVIEKARASAKKAVELSPLLCEAHTSLGVVLLKYDWDWRRAEEAFQRAIELNSDYTPAHFGYSTLLMVTGRFDEAIRVSERNKALDPFSSPAILNVGRAYYFARRYDVAVEYCQEVLDRQPQNESALYILGASYVQQGKYRKAIETLEKLYAIKPLFAAAPLGYVYGKAGQRADALRILNALPELSKGSPVPAQEKAIISIGLGDKDSAFMYLEEAYRERFVSLISLTVEPLFDDLRPDPRYADLARRMNLRP